MGLCYLSENLVLHVFPVALLLCFDYYYYLLFDNLIIGAVNGGSFELKCLNLAN